MFWEKNYGTILGIMRLYDVVLVVKTSLSEDKRKKLISSIKDFVKEGKFGKEELMGRKILSYPIKKETDGYFVQLTIEAEAIPSNFEKRILSQEDILRHLVIRKK